MPATGIQLNRENGAIVKIPAKLAVKLISAIAVLAEWFKMANGILGKNKMKILAIETSCDDTGIALLECFGGIKKPQFKVLKNLVSSQIAVHQPYHGVVPNLAKREHIKNLPKILKKLSPKPSTLNPDYISVTVGPGLEPALWAGI